MKTMFYGSGTDKRRAEFRDSVTIQTKTVDASPFVTVEPAQAKAREKDWGFGVNNLRSTAACGIPTEWAVSARARTAITIRSTTRIRGTDTWASCWRRADSFSCRSMRIINGGLRGESDGRAWLLLKHLEVWKRLERQFRGSLLS